MKSRFNWQLAAFDADWRLVHCGPRELAEFTQERAQQYQDYWDLWVDTRPRSEPRPRVAWISGHPIDRPAESIAFAVESRGVTYFRLRRWSFEHGGGI